MSIGGALTPGGDLPRFTDVAFRIAVIGDIIAIQPVGAMAIGAALAPGGLAHFAYKAFRIPVIGGAVAIQPGLASVCRTQGSWNYNAGLPVFSRLRLLRCRLLWLLRLLRLLRRKLSRLFSGARHPLPMLSLSLLSLLRLSLLPVHLPVRCAHRFS